jgi:hypothetical protein
MKQDFERGQAVRAKVYKVEWYLTMMMMTIKIGIKQSSLNSGSFTNNCLSQGVS